MDSFADVWVDELPRRMQALERALLRRGVRHRDASRERCSRCRRTPLVGERVYLAEAGPVICATCRSGEAPVPSLSSRIVRGPGVGRTIRILDQSAA